MSLEQKINFSIQRAEEKWLDKSILFVSALFKTVFLPSHDVAHHLRTWRHAKVILTELSELNKSVDFSIVEAVFLASMFHDTGMVDSRSAEHGANSKKHYLDFIQEQNAELPLLHADIIRAIELHDHKDEYLFIPFSYKEAPDILTLISIADDLDALGIIGIYRYAEIYLHRGVTPKNLGMEILENVSIRFNHLSKASTLLPGFINQARNTYREIINFFDEYNQQCLIETNLEATFNGHVGVVNYIRQFSVDGDIPPEHFLDTLSNFKVGKFVLNYFETLENAIKKTMR